MLLLLLLLLLLLQSFLVQALAACSAAAVFRVVTAAQTRPLVMSLRFQVRRIDGTAVCEIEADEDQECQVLKQQVSDHLGVCTYTRVAK